MDNGEILEALRPLFRRHSGIRQFVADLAPRKVIEGRDELLGLQSVDREVVRDAKKPASWIFDLLSPLHCLVKLQECFLGNIFRLERGSPAKNGDQVMKNGVA